MAEADRRLRQQLALSGELFAGYHPDMRVLHETNARELELAVDDEGWPSNAEIGEDGTEAAFLIALHAISRPSFQRRCLTLMKSAANRGDIPARHPAILEDRIRAFEGRPQLYGTQLDWDDDGHLIPLPIENEEAVDSRRAKVGLPPLAATVAETEAKARREGEHPPAEWLHRQQAMADFAHEIGWR
ncbi:hypothetical protein KEC16_14875 [Magnetospirillum sp. J10]|uniref:Uncharacterized protein n=2 Tax=Magnetospirillum sulfuroxidans TaxID=611300 RepID=A0ABS5IFH1_9PROT|nr:hypothetical protein [Magnetospirillum sulfuroxidans]